MMGTMTIIKTFFDFSGSGIRVAAWDMDPIDQFDAYQLLFLATFSVFMLIMTIIQYYVLDPKDFTHSLDLTMVVDFTKYGPEHQLCKHINFIFLVQDSEQRSSIKSAPYANAKFARLDDTEFNYTPDYGPGENIIEDGEGEDSSER